METEYSFEQCQEYLREHNLESKDFYVNIYGWQRYYTLEPTFATPSGILPKYPRTFKMINLTK
jgi:hypothetical protein